MCEYSSIVKRCVGLTGLQNEEYIFYLAGVLGLARFKNIEYIDCI